MRKLLFILLLLPFIVKAQKAVMLPNDEVINNGDIIWRMGNQWRSVTKEEAGIGSGGAGGTVDSLSVLGNLTVFGGVNFKSLIGTGIRYVTSNDSGDIGSRTTSELKIDLALDKSDVGLANVDNTSDLSKPISTAVQNALNLKANAVNTAFKNQYNTFTEAQAIVASEAGFDIINTNISQDSYIWVGHDAGFSSAEMAAFPDTYINPELSGKTRTRYNSLNGNIFEGLVNLGTDTVEVLTFRSNLNARGIGIRRNSNLIFHNYTKGILRSDANGNVIADSIVTSEVVADSALYPNRATGALQMRKLPSVSVPSAIPPTIVALQAAGSPIKSMPVGLDIGVVQSSAVLTDGQMLLMLHYLYEPATLTGIKYWSGTAGNYVSDNFNGAVLFSSSGGVITQVAISANNGNQWKSAANTIQSIPFTTPYVAAPGLYVVGYLYNSSSQTTAPSVGIGFNAPNLVFNALDLGNSMKLNGALNAVTTPASSYNWSAVQSTINRIWSVTY